jgi:cytochrome c-type biogenesis protein CcmE
VKKIHIIILVIIAITIGIIVVSFGKKMSTYETFASAKEKMGTTFRVSAILDTTQHKVMYDPMANSNLLVFYAKDQNGEIQKVTFLDSKPEGFERSEKLMMIGRMTEEGFVCEKLQLKCPSKYEDHETSFEAQNV